jgi:transcription initiation factor TFIIIB Brf1 subunit/transcription initiation factor TFIIB
LYFFTMAAATATATAKARTTGAHLGTEHQAGVLRSLINLNSIPEDVARHHDQTLRPLLSSLFVACNILQVSAETRFTGGILLHRYYAACPKDQRTDNVQWVVAACLFLACKTEEEPRRLRDVINCANMIQWDEVKAKESSSSGSGKGTEVSRKRPRSSDRASGDDQSDPIQATSTTSNDVGSTRAIPVIQWDPQPPSLDETYWEGKETIVRTEQNVLRWLAFDTTVSHPHRAVLVILQQKQLFTQLSLSPETRAVLIAKAWRRLNDALFHVVALQHGILELAAASIYLAAAELDQETDDSTLHSLVKTQGSVTKRLGLSGDAVQAAQQSLRDATESLNTK